MRILVACETSARVRDAFRARGHDAWSCDLLPTEGDPRWHIVLDVRDVIADRPGLWDMVLAFPPCTYLCLSGIHWNNRIPGRREKTEEALAFVRWLLDLPVPNLVLENPVGVISTRIRKPDQIIQPWQYGHAESKQTALWLRGVSPLVPTNVLAPTEFQANGRPRWGNQTGTGQNKLGPSAHRARIRGRTYLGIAAAMAEQWGGA